MLNFLAHIMGLYPWEWQSVMKKEKSTQFMPSGVYAATVLVSSHPSELPGKPNTVNFLVLT